MMNARPILFALIAGMILAAVLGHRAHAEGSTSAHHETGIASWYGSMHEDGRKRPYGGPVACPGRRIGPMTAAHKSLPCGARVRVTTRDRAGIMRGALLTITDRGPFVRGRIIDVSPDAARVLGLIGPGVLPVTVERVQ